MLAQKIENIKVIAIGALGAGTSAGVENIANVVPIDVPATMSVITQIVILFATLIGLFKKKNNTNNQKL